MPNQKITSWLTDETLYEGDHETLAKAVVAAVGCDADLRGADLCDADLCDADLYGANLYGANLYGANLYDADLYGANLYGANLRGADLCDADLYGANLYGANLYGADLRGANLCEADLRGADLRGADLRGANLCDADLRGANLRGANFRDAYYRGRKWNRAPLIKTVTGAPWAFGEDGETGKYWIGCKCKTLDEWEAHFANPNYQGSVNETWRKLYMIELRAMDEQVKIMGEMEDI